MGAGTAHQHAGSTSYGNPFSEDDSIQFSDGTGQFKGLHGTASFHQFSAGAVFQGTLTGTLSDWKVANLDPASTCLALQLERMLRCTRR